MGVERIQITMSEGIEGQINAEFKEAMRAKDQRRVDVIRMVRTEAAKARTAPGFKGEVDDQFWLAVLAAYVKRLENARKEYLNLGERGAEPAEKLLYEIDYLAKWLPKKLGEAETQKLVTDAIAEIGVTDPKQAGRVIGQIMKKHKGEVDGALVKQMVNKALGA